MLRFLPFVIQHPFSLLQSFNYVLQIWRCPENSEKFSLERFPPELPSETISAAVLIATTVAFGRMALILDLLEAESAKMPWLASARRSDKNNGD